MLGYVLIGMVDRPPRYTRETYILLGSTRYTYFATVNDLIAAKGSQSRIEQVNNLDWEKGS